MNERVQELVAGLDLAPHPEGGYYREVFRSGRQVDPCDERGLRSAVTTIYFLLVEGEESAWHRVRSDEVWHYYEGDPLMLSWRKPGAAAETRLVLGQWGPGRAPVAVVPADCWQTARSLGTYTLVGCTVGPGFDFDDFELGLPQWAAPAEGALDAD